MTSEEKTQEAGQEQSVEVGPLGIFTTEFLATLRDNRFGGCAQLAAALNILAQSNLLRVFSPDVRTQVYVQTATNELTFNEHVTSVTHNGNVQLNCQPAIAWVEDPEDTTPLFASQ